MDDMKEELNKMLEHEKMLNTMEQELKKQYDKVSSVVGSHFVVKKGNILGVVSFYDNIRKEYMFEGLQEIDEFNTLPYDEDNLFCVKKNDMWGYIDSKGQEIVPCIYKDSDALVKMVNKTCSLTDKSKGVFSNKYKITNLVDVNDKNFYRVLMYSIKNRYELWRNKELMSDFVFKVEAIIEALKEIKTKSEILKDGLAELQEFYDENLKVSINEQTT